MIREYKTIREVVSPLMVVKEVEGVTYDELAQIELPDGSIRHGKVLEVNGDTAVVQLFDDARGINLAQSAASAQAGGRVTAANLRYNLGRLVSYTIVGGLIGAIGSVFKLSNAVQAAIQLVEGSLEGWTVTTGETA